MLPKHTSFPAFALVILALGFLAPASVESEEEFDLEGLWVAQRRFGPELQGELTLDQDGEDWRIEIAARRATARVEGDELLFELAGQEGSLRLKRPVQDRPATGHWIQPESAVHGVRYASPVSLSFVGEGRWQGVLVPFEDVFTFHMPVSRRSDGSFGAFLRNPERNQGIYWNLDRLELEGETVNFLSGSGEGEEVAARAILNREDERISVYMQGRGGHYDFTRHPAGLATTFNPRLEHPAGPLEHHLPPSGADGWPVGDLKGVGIDFDPIRRLVEEHLSSPPSSVNHVYPHAILIARHGRLVFEEYFHGFHRERPHDSRSASKSLASVLAGAAMEAGVALRKTTSVYETLRSDEAVAAERSSMQLQHLLTMSSGLACNDSDSDSPGGEDRMQNQEEQPDWYEFTLDLPMAGTPGENAFYCSATANLVGAVVSEAAGESLASLFQRLVADPMEMGRYHLPLMPTGEPYMGGGVRWLPRDFLKLGQLMLNGGTWKGTRILSQEWVAESIKPSYEMFGRDYGYLWWSVEYPYKDRAVRAFFAAGNGGQVVIGVPELDLLVGFMAGNYSDSTLFRYQQEFFPEYILPAVQEAARSEGD